MIVFATTTCKRAAEIHLSGFSDAADSDVARYMLTPVHSGVYCSELPLSADTGCIRHADQSALYVDLPAGYHVVIVLDVPDAVLDQCAVSLNEEPFGWLLPADTANRYLRTFPGWAIDYGVRSSVRQAVHAEDLFVDEGDEFERRQPAWLETLPTIRTALEAIKQRRAIIAVANELVGNAEPPLFEFVDAEFWGKHSSKRTDGRMLDRGNAG